jgi:hypothetical protein
MAPWPYFRADECKPCRSNGLNLQIVQKKHEQTFCLAEFYFKPTIDRLSEEKAQKLLALAHLKFYLYGLRSWVEMDKR